MKQYKKGEMYSNISGKTMELQKRLHIKKRRQDGEG